MWKISCLFQYKWRKLGNDMEINNILISWHIFYFFFDRKAKNKQIMFILNWFIEITERIINFQLFSTHTTSEIEGSDTSRKICVRCPIKILAGKLGRKNLRSRLIYIAPINMIIFPWRVAYTHSTIYMHCIYIYIYIHIYFVFSHL